MIRKVVITDDTKCCVPWWGKVAWLKDKTEILFKPGLNIIYGPNGSGKSTLLTLLARTLCCEQGDVQVLTQDALSALAPYSKGFLNGVLPDHDGAPVVHFDPGKAVGLIGGMAGFDYDFGLEGALNAIRKASSGQTTLSRMETILGVVLEQKWPKLDVRVASHHADTAKGIAEVEAFLAGTGEQSQPTLILDEPGRSLDLGTDARLMEMVGMLADNMQIIMATHSPFALHFPKAHYIDTAPGYSEAGKANLEIHVLAAMYAESPDLIPKMVQFLKDNPRVPRPLPTPQQVAKDKAKFQTKPKKR